jgi:DUF4097 and DUF4098 domain-containing protein YvlB
MRRSLPLVVSLLLAGPLAAGEHYHSHSPNLNISVDSSDPITRCDQIRVTYDGDRVPVTEEIVRVAGLRSLRVRAPRNGGIHVTGSNDAGYSVRACKASVPGGDSASRITVSNDEVSSDGSSDDTVVFFIVRAPQNATLDLEASNGQVAVDGVNGTITAHAENGPVSIKGSTGTIDASAVNGPVAFSGNSGNVKLRAQNGPISVKLLGGGWGAGSLDARTENGPVALKMPHDFRSGVVVESDGHGPVSCRGEACRAAQRSFNDDDRPRRIELGSGTMAVHISTVNGPIAIRDQE